MLKIYLDCCCYGRPFDDLSQEKVKNEAIAKMFIQSLVKYKSLVLCSSYMLSLEISEIPFDNNKEHILSFVSNYAGIFVSKERESETLTLTDKIMETGIKRKDAVHLACSMIAECDYFITTDKRVLNYKTDRIKVINPIEFVKTWREQHD
jgi:predicted nucleic acid-binding protein